MWLLVISSSVTSFASGLLLLVIVIVTQSLCVVKASLPVITTPDFSWPSSSKNFIKINTILEWGG